MLSHKSAFTIATAVSFTILPSVTLANSVGLYGLFASDKSPTSYELAHDTGKSIDEGLTIRLAASDRGKSLDEGLTISSNTNSEEAATYRTAAAVLGDPNAVEFVPTTGKTRFTALASGEIDMLARNTTWTFSRDVDLKFDFVGVNYYDGQGFMVPKDLGVSSAKDLDGATVCIQTGTTTELNLADFFRTNGISYEPVPIETNAETQPLYLDGACDVYTTDASGLAATRAAFENQGDHVLLPEIISKEPLGPVVRHGDNEWGDVVRWTLNALITAEELGVTSANVGEMSSNTSNPEVARLLGTEGTLGEMLGLDADTLERAVKTHGNYGEVFSSNIGLARGLNAQWSNGGVFD